MHPHLHAALVRVHTEEIARRAARSRLTKPRTRRAEEHTYTLPHVRELRRKAEPGTFDPSVW